MHEGEKGEETEREREKEALRLPQSKCRRSYRGKNFLGQWHAVSDRL